MTPPERVEKISHILRRKSRDVLVLVLVVAVIGPVLLLTQYVLSQRTSAVYTPVVDTTSRVVITMRWAQSDLQLDRAYGLPGSAAKLRTREVEARAAVEQLYEIAGDDPAFAPGLEEMSRAADTWWRYATTEASIEPGSPSDQPAAPPRQDPEAQTAFTRVIDAADGLHTLATDKRAEMRTWRSVILVGGSAVAILLVVVISLAIVRDTRRTAALIATPIEGLDRVARTDAGGARGMRADTEHGPAEVRALAAAFNDLLDTRDRFEAGREDQVRRLEELDRQKDDFVSTVSHELRTPLASIIGYTEMLEDGDAGELSGPQLRLVSVVRRNADRLRGLIEDLLVLSRIEAKGLEIDHRRVELGDVVAGVVESLGPVATRAGVALHSDRGGAVVEGDPIQLERAVTNLVSNAVKFTPARGEVDVRVIVDDDLVTVEVADTGIGVPAAEQENLGTRFFRATTAQRESIPGTGLGLSIVRAIAEGHAGRLTFESAEGVGATFRLTLPLPDGHAAP